MNDYLLYILFIAAIALSFGAQIKVSSTFRKYSRFQSGRGRTASEVARRILDAHGLYNVRIELVRGHLSDHYDPRAEVLRLSESVYNSSSAAAVGVAAHEVGHAIQHSEEYGPLVMRTRLVPAVNFSSAFSWIAIVLGILIMGLSGLADVGLYFVYGGIILFSVTTLFHLITLPVEFNASSRALSELELTGWYSSGEIEASRKVLSAAAMTYVAALAVSVIQLLRLLSMVRRDD